MEPLAHIPHKDSLACSKDRPNCTKCLQNRRPCHYSGKTVRSPLTRAYLTIVERRVETPERLLAEQFPDLNVEEALESPGCVVVAFSSSSDAVTHTPSPGPHRSSNCDEANTEPESEAVPREADGYDWKEEANSMNELADGMASLAIDPTGSGYLGSTAGVYFLRLMLFWLGNPQLPLAPFQRQPSSFDVEQVAASSRLSQAFLSHEVASKLSMTWQMLFYTILALGAWCLKNNERDLDDYLYHCALSFGEDESMFESANLTFVQTLVLLSNLSQKRNKSNTGGVCKYLFDSGASTIFGRPILLPGKESMDVKYVLNIQDEALTPKTSVLPAESCQPTIYSGMKAQSDFHVHTNHISNRLLSPSGMPANEALALNKGLDDWSTRLPSFFQLNEDLASNEPWYIFVRCRLWWRFWNFKITLFRQILLKRVIGRKEKALGLELNHTEDQCRDVCIAAAHSTVVSIDNYVEQAALTRLAEYEGDLSRVLADNPLASRCAEIFDKISPLNWPGDPGFLDLNEFGYPTGPLDSLIWPPELNSMIYPFGFTEFGHGEEFP
ncbi:MAG: hypothetical protein FE78DRAFT_106226 [Acidomyces sp. 'richmondensis']|nr:MAG: hypothetical protein FE78DRAFT_106226 [Acidomyces sp. 'richmondensis']